MDFQNYWRGRLKSLRDALGLTQKDLAIKAGISQSQVNMLETGTRTFTQKTLEPIIEALGCTYSDVFSFDDLPLVEMPKFILRPIPVISKIHAGHWEEAIDNYPPGASEEAEPVFSRKTLGPNAFALVVDGDSMEPRFMAGDIVIIDPSLECRSGAVCVVKVRDDVTLKVFRDTNGEYRFDPTNDKYPSTVISKDGKTPFRIIGPVVDLVPKIS